MIIWDYFFHLNQLKNKESLWFDIVKIKYKMETRLENSWQTKLFKPYTKLKLKLLCEHK